MDLLLANEINRAADAAGWPHVTPAVRPVWTSPIEGEDGAPDRRIIHCRIMQLHTPARLQRLGLRRSPGYSKCGSRVQIDWPSSFRLLVWNGDRWSVHRQENHLPRPFDDSPRWFDLGSVPAQAAIIELRRCAIDDWWTSWNLALGAPIVEGELEPTPCPGRETRLTIEGIDLSSVPKGVTAKHKPGEVRFRTRHFEVGFELGRPGFSFLSLGQGSSRRTVLNLLRLSPAVALQGIRFLPVGAPPVVAPLLHHDVSGSVAVHNNSVTYSVRLDRAGQEYRISWEVLNDMLIVRLRRSGIRDVRVWDGSAWTVSCDSRVAPTTVLGRIVRMGESGILTYPVLFHAPGHGTVRFSLPGGEGILRSDSFRPLTMTTLALKTGEVPQKEGDYLLPAGIHELESAIEPFTYRARLLPGTPVSVALAVKRCALTAMSYRADTATLSNNGNSIHAPLCMDSWSAGATRIGALMRELNAVDLLRDSIERWLDGGPGYASGGFEGDEGLHAAEDEYLMTGAASLLGVGEYLAHSGTTAWLGSYAPRLERQLRLMRARDIDHDGIVESRYRDGNSGGHGWSTNWYDAISYGWKDALSNALLYRALILLDDMLPRLGRPELGSGLKDWSEKLRVNFLPAFFNDRTGWLGGWRSKDGTLHDYAFLAVNGAAVMSGVIPAHTGLSVLRALWNEATRTGLPDPRLGLPGNLWPVPDDDMAEVMHGRPLGYYLNGGLTHSQSFRFVGALYRVGMTAEADLLLDALCATLADGSAFGGCTSGVDWRYRDGGPCGYEGLLTDQFGILAVALDRYGARRGESP